MTVKADLIDLFSRRPSLSPLARALLRGELKRQFPHLPLDPDVAVITEVSESGEPTSETLTACLHRLFAVGNTPQWRAGVNTLLIDPTLPDVTASDVDMETLAVVFDTVSLSLLDHFMAALVTFWDQPEANGLSPGVRLAAVLEERHPGPDASVASEHQALSVLDAQLTAIQGVPALGLADFAEIERYLAKITDITPLLIDARDTAIASRLSRLEQLPPWLSAASPADRLDYSRKLAALAVVTEQSERWADSVARMAELAAPEPVEPPAALAAELRPYQQEGFEWLVFLYRHGLGGILADDMGLGKTVQTLALCLHVLERRPDARVLVVAPTSVVQNWAREAARFAPGVNICTISQTEARRRTALADEIAEAEIKKRPFLRGIRIKLTNGERYDLELMLLRAETMPIMQAIRDHAEAATANMAPEPSRRWW